MVKENGMVELSNRLNYEHRIPIAIEAVSSGNRFSIGLGDEVFAGECGYQYQER